MKKYDRDVFIPTRAQYKAVQSHLSEAESTECDLK